MAFGKFDEQYYIPNQSFFLYDQTSYMRLNSDNNQSKLYRVDQLEIHYMMQNAFDHVWQNDDNLLTDDRQQIIQHIQQISRMI